MPGIKRAEMGEGKGAGWNETVDRSDGMHMSCDRNDLGSIETAHREIKWKDTKFIELNDASNYKREEEQDAHGKDCPCFILWSHACWDLTKPPHSLLICCIWAHFLRGILKRYMCIHRRKMLSKQHHLLQVL